jgi:hypothetical protein
MVVDYCKVNKKICFDLYPLPKIEQAFQQFSGASCTPFELYEFSKLPMVISIGCQGLSHVVDNLFADLKGEYVF